MDNKYQNKVVYFKGDAVVLSGKTVVLHGATFYEGTYMEGHKTGESVLIIESIVKLYVA